MSTQTGWTPSRYGLSKSAEQTVRANVNALQAICERADGEPGAEPFSFGDGDANTHVIRLLQHTDNALRTVARPRNEANVYELDPRVIDLLEDRLALVPDCKPCPHTGMVHRMDGEFGCSFPECDASWDEATQERINAARGDGE